LYIKKEEGKELQYGDKIKLTGEFSPPDTNRNYKGFNYKEYLKVKKIYGSIFAGSENIKVLEKKQGNILYGFANNIRNSITKKAENILPKETSGLLTGILLGDKSDISEELIKSFKTSSLSHILAVSGAHTSYIILGITYLLNRSKLSKKKTNISVILVLLVFMTITGFTPSFVRACIMGILLLGSKIFYRKQDIWTSIFLSLLIILIENPFSISDIGLQLSYVGTIGIILFNKNIEEILSKTKINQKIITGLSITFSAQILLIPIMIYTFNTISFTFFISNILAMPLLGLIISLGFVNIFVSFLSISFAKLLAIILDLLLKMLITVSELTSKLPLSNVIVKTPYLITVFIYCVSILLINYIYLIIREERKDRRIYKKIIKLIKNINKRKVAKILAITILIIKLSDFAYANITKDLRIFFIDVSQR
jgi:competence protein ComEC